MSWRQQEECEQRQFEEEAYQLSLDADPTYVAWLHFESLKLLALIESSERQNGNV